MGARLLKVTLGDHFATVHCGEWLLRMQPGPADAVVSAFWAAALRGLEGPDEADRFRSHDSDRARLIAEKAGLDKFQIAAIASMIEATGRTPPIVSKRKLRSGGFELAYSVNEMWTWFLKLRAALTDEEIERFGRPFGRAISLRSVLERFERRSAAVELAGVASADERAHDAGGAP